jgi:nucleoside-diphosphate-sugar epimerase
MKIKILITGSTGFVGRHIVKALPEESTHLKIIVRYHQESELLASRSDLEVIYTRDLFAESVDWWKSQCRDVDVVIHAAWFTEPGSYLCSTLNFECLIGSFNLCKGALLAGVKRVVGIGTCFEYQMSSMPLSIDTPLNPTTPYAAAKASLYTGLSQLLKNEGVEFVWCRLFYLFGDGEDPRRLFAYLHTKLAKQEPVELTDGNQIRDYIDVQIAGRIIAKAATGKQIGQINVCSGVPTTVKEIATKIAKKFNRLDLIKFGTRSMNVFDPPYVVGVPNFAEKVG